MQTKVMKTQSIKRQESAVVEYREKEWVFLCYEMGQEEKKEKAHRLIEDKIAQENETRLGLEVFWICVTKQTEITQMEQEELDLIQKLQRTEQLQQTGK